jgi:acetyl esterase
MPIDWEVQQVLEQYALFGAPPIPSLSPQEARRAPTLADAVNSIRQKRGERLTSEPVGAVYDRVIWGPEGEIPVRMYRPASGGPLPVLVYFHGGGWVLGDLESCDAACRALANLAQCLVISVAYRLAPEHTFPAAVQDAYAATQWAMEMAEVFQGDPARVAVGGESAGGNLAAAVALMARDSGTRLPIYQVLVYPAMDDAFDTPSYQQYAETSTLSREEMRWFWRQYLPDEAAGANPYASPLRADDLRGLPPALILTAEYDPLRDEGEAYGRRLQAAGVPVIVSRYDGMVHGFLGMAPVVERARDALAEVAAELRSAFNAATQVAQPQQVAEAAASVEIQRWLQLVAVGPPLPSAPAMRAALVAGDQVAQQARLQEKAATDAGVPVRPAEALAGARGPVPEETRKAAADAATTVDAAKLLPPIKIPDDFSAPGNLPLPSDPILET